MTRSLSAVQREAMNDLLSTFSADWLREWSSFVLGLMLGAALSTGSVDVGLAVIGLPLAWAVRMLARRRPGPQVALVGCLAGVGLLAGLLAPA